jgi:protein-disulfide isomerase
VLEEYPDRVQLLAKPFPPADNQASLRAASAALAAHAQGRFWDFREQLFLIAGPPAARDLRAIALRLEMDVPRLLHDMVSADIQGLLARGINDGVRRGVAGTPTVFVNQTPVLSPDLDNLRQAVQRALDAL